MSGMTKKQIKEEARQKTSSLHWLSHIFKTAASHGWTLYPCCAGFYLKKRRRCVIFDIGAANLIHVRYQENDASQDYGHLGDLDEHVCGEVFRIVAKLTPLHLRTRWRVNK